MHESPSPPGVFLPPLPEDQPPPPPWPPPGAWPPLYWPAPRARDGLAELLSEAARLYVRGWALLIGIALLFQLPAIFAGFVFGVRYRDLISQLASVGYVAAGAARSLDIPLSLVVSLPGYLLLWQLSTWLANAALMIAVGRLTLGEEASLRLVISVLFERLGSYVRQSLASWALWAAALILFGTAAVGLEFVNAAGLAALLLLAVVPVGIWIEVKLFAWPLAVLLERQGTVAGARRSWQLTTGQWWLTFGTLFIAGLLGLLFNVVIVGVGALSGGSELVAPVVGAVALPWGVIPAVVVWKELRGRQTQTRPLGADDGRAEVITRRRQAHPRFSALAVGIVFVVAGILLVAPIDAPILHFPLPSRPAALGFGAPSAAPTTTPKPSSQLPASLVARQQSVSFAGYAVKTDERSGITSAAARGVNPGYPVIIDQITSVSALWVHPQIECDLWRSSGFSIWIGVDDGAGHLLAVGSSTDCTKGLSHSYVWYRDAGGVETYVDDFTGQRAVSAALVVTRDGWQVYLADPNLIDPWTTSVQYPFRATIAIWAAGMTMTADQRLYPLSTFGVVSFSDAIATSVLNDTETRINDPNWTSVARYDLANDQVTAAETSPLSDDGHGFSVYWRHKMSAPPPAATPSPVPTPLPAVALRDVKSPGRSGFTSAALESTEVAAVSAGWTAPTIVCRESGSGLFMWVAIGNGYDSSIAIGTATVCNGNQPSSYAWFTPNGWQMEELGPIDQGGAVTASIAHVDGAWQLSLEPSAANSTYDKTVDFTRPPLNASWMLASDAMGGTTAHPLPEFTRTSFTDCTAKVSGLGAAETDLGILGPGWATVTHFQLVGRDGQTRLETSMPQQGEPSTFDATWLPE